MAAADTQTKFFNNKTLFYRLCRFAVNAGLLEMLYSRHLKKKKKPYNVVTFTNHTFKVVQMSGGSRLIFLVEKVKWKRFGNNHCDLKSLPPFALIIRTLLSTLINKLGHVQFHAFISVSFFR